MPKLQPLRVPVQLAYRGVVYDFARFEFHYGHDGSFYLFFAGRDSPAKKSIVSRHGSEAKEVVSRTFKLSYHASGQINFDGPRFPSIFADPLAAMTTPQLLVYQQIPDLQRLPDARLKANQENIISFPDDITQPFAIEFWIAPFESFAPTPEVLFACGFEDMFRLELIGSPSAFNKVDLAEAFVRAIPVQGVREHRAMAIDDAAAAFHARATGSTASVLSLGEGRYRYYFFPAMRRCPRVRTESQADGVECRIENATPYFVQFRLMGPNGGIDTDEPLSQVRFSLDAEL
jgi:hypothetical protein